MREIIVKKTKTNVKRYYESPYQKAALYEAQGFSRLWNHWDTGFFIMSAFQETSSLAENMEKHKNFKADLKKYDLGFWEVDGGYVHDDGTSVDELSLLIPARPEVYSEEEFKDIASGLCEDYKQESAAYIFNNNGSPAMSLLYRDGKEEIMASQISFDKFSQVYTKLRKGAYAGHPFVFESVQETAYSFFGIRTPSNVASIRGLKHKGYLIKYDTKSDVEPSNNSDGFLCAKESLENLLEKYDRLLVYKGFIKKINKQTKFSVFDCEHAIDEFHARFPGLDLSDYIKVLEKGAKIIIRDYGLILNHYVIESKITGIRIPIEVKFDRDNPSIIIGVTPDTLTQKHFHNTHNETKTLAEKYDYAKAEVIYGFNMYVDGDEIITDYDEIVVD